MRLGLALSGGGLRATFFHLGVIRYLSEHGFLHNVKHITSVSGGSILAGHLVLNWADYLEPSRFDKAARKLAAFGSLDVRGRILRRLPTHFPLTYFHKMRLRRPRTVRNQLFESYLTDHLYSDVTLRKAREKQLEVPSLDILATNLTRGTLAYFTDDCFVPDEKRIEKISTEVSLAKAVAISAAFPGFFPPIELDNEDLGVDNEVFPTTEYLTDGGVYDNLGLRRFRTLLSNSEPPVDLVLVCDASGHFDWVDSREESLGLLKTALRSTEIFMKRLAELEGEVFAIDGTTRFIHIPISDTLAPSPVQDGNFLSITEQQLLKNIRTDLDYFSAIEIDSLERHGYSIAEAKCRLLAADNTRATSHSSDGVPVTSKDRLRILKDARLRHLRFFSLNDRISYAHLLVFMLVLIAPGFFFVSDLRRDHFLSSLHSYKRDTFGQFELKNSAEAVQLLDRCEAAQKRWPTDSGIQTDIALAAYSAFNSAPEYRDRSFKLFEKALTTLKELPELTRSEQMTYHQLQGHYLLAEGERLRSAGDPEGAREKYLVALESYESFRRLSFQNLHALEFNLCNTARMVGRLDYALERCAAADRYARENRLSFWQAKAITGRIYEKQGNLERAASVFHEAWEIAARASATEEGRLREFLAWDVKEYPALCIAPSFKEDLAELCSPPGVSVLAKTGHPGN